MSSLERLAHIEATEFAAINLLAHPDLKPERRPEVVKMLGRLRTEKQRILAQDDTLLRKSAATAPAAEPKGQRVFESQPHQRGMKLHHNSSRGLRTIEVPHNGMVLLAEGDREGHQFLRQRGFKDCGPLVEPDGTTKASTAETLAMFKPSRLQRLTGLPFTGARLR